MASSLTVKTTLNMPVIPVAGNARMVYLLVEVSGGEDAQSLPLNLGLVIDASESMHIRMVTQDQFRELVGRGNTREILTDGIPAWEIDSIPGEMVSSLPRKIDYVKEALIVVSEYLRPSDYYALAAFASRSVQLIPMTSGKDRQKLLQNARDLDYLHLGDETCMAEGLAMAYAEIQEKQRGNLASRIILLTDGYTQDVKECYQWAKRARQIGLAITTMGVGVEFNEDLLIPIAEMTGGNAYYIESPEKIPGAFRKELGAALGVSYRNLKLHLKPSPGVALRHLYRLLPELGSVEGETAPDGQQTHYLGHYDPNAPPAFLAEMIVPALPAGAYRLLHFDFSWDGDQGEKDSHVIQDDLVAKIEPSPKVELNSRVMGFVDKVGAFKLGNYALEQAHSPDRAAAVNQLRHAAARFTEVGEPGLAAEMSRMADALHKQGKIDSNATKRLRYDTRHITRHGSS
jgi:Ca-activated chloride channel family protein